MVDCLAFTRVGLGLPRGVRLGDMIRGFLFMAVTSVCWSTASMGTFWIWSAESRTQTQRRITVIKSAKLWPPSHDGKHRRKRQSNQRLHDSRLAARLMIFPLIKSPFSCLFQSMDSLLCEEISAHVLPLWIGQGIVHIRYNEHGRMHWTARAVASPR